MAIVQVGSSERRGAPNVVEEVGAVIVLATLTEMVLNSSGFIKRLASASVGIRTLKLDPGVCTEGFARLRFSVDPNKLRFGVLREGPVERGSEVKDWAKSMVAFGEGEMFAASVE